MTAESVGARADLRLALPALATWASAALVPLLIQRGWRLGGLLTAVGAVTTVAAVIMISRRGDQRTANGNAWRRVTAASLLCAASGAWVSGAHALAVATGPVPELADRHATARLQLVVTGDAHPTAARVRGSVRRPDLVVVPATVRVISWGGHRSGVRTPVLVLASGRGWGTLLPSQQVEIVGRLSPAEDGQALGAVISARGPPQRVTQAAPLQRAAGHLRDGLRQASGVLPDERRGLLPGLVVGDTSRLDPGLADDFRATGLTHLLAVSGANCAIVLAAVLTVVRAARAGPRVTLTACLAALSGFVLLARPEPSVLRAAVMGGVAVVGLGVGRPGPALPRLSAAVLGLVLAQPTLATAPGFALSVVATGALLVLAPRWRQRLAHRLPGPLATAIALPAAAQAACLPLIVVIAAQVSLVAVPANLLAEPAVAPATLLGVLATLLAPVWPSAAAGCAWLAGYPLGWIAAVAHVGAGLPGAVLPWPGGLTGALLVLAATVAVVVVLRRRAARLTAGAALVGVVGVAAGTHVLAPAWPPADWRFVACAVGQGDALALAAGPGRAVVVDAGPDARLVDDCLRRLGVREVPLIVLSHLHADHVEGLPGVLRGRRVGAVEVGPLDEPAAEWSRVRRWTAAAGVPLLRARVGETGRQPGVAWQVLAPRTAYHGTDSDPNNSSLVLRAQLGRTSILLTGDVEPPAQEDLLASGVAVHADVLKIPHHGSDHQDPHFLDAVGPRLALASVGADNPYGHPSSRTLGRLRADGVRTYRTDLDGSIAAVGSGPRLRAVAENGTGVAPLPVQAALAQPWLVHTRGLWVVGWLATGGRCHLRRCRRVRAPPRHRHQWRGGTPGRQSDPCPRRRPGRGWPGRRHRARRSRGDGRRTR